MERVQLFAVLLRCFRMREIVTLSMGTIGMEALPFGQKEIKLIFDRGIFCL